MQVFEVKGFTGFVKLVAAIVGVLFVFIALPSLFLMVAWNAIVFEGFQGPLIDWYQGVLLWLIMAVAFKVIFNPEIHLEFKKIDDPKNLDKDLKS